MVAEPARAGLALSEPVVRLVVAALLGTFLGLEREWSEKSAGVRTFALTSVAGALLTLLARETGVGAGLLAVGAALVVVQGVLLAVPGLRTEPADPSLKLTTAVSLLVAYAVGATVAAGLTLVGVAAAVVSAVLLVLKRELHSFAGALSREELRSTAEFAVLAFVVYPLLPAGSVAVAGVAVEARVAWLMVVTVAGIGVVNYVLVRTYGGQGLVVTGFLGGLASSTAVVGTMLDHVADDPAAVDHGVAAVVLANGAMALRNLGLVLALTLFADGPTLVRPLLPLGVLVVASVVAAALAGGGRGAAVDLDSPFSLRNALGFGALFLLVLVVSAAAQSTLGTGGLYAGAGLSGLVSSAGATTSAALLYRTGAVAGEAAAVAVLLATAASILVKVGLSWSGPRRFAYGVTGNSAAVLGLAALALLV
ncbi:MAG: DUF4010 domain-containing protein [Haloferacaceae archaeon]|jgi:uncharacterized membrane protein (DUF4010 family)